MRKFFFGLGIVTAIVIVVLSIAFGILAWQGSELDKESTAFGDESVLAIAKDWSVDELWKRASSKLRQNTNKQDLSRFFGALHNALGPLIEYDGGKGHSITFVGTQSSITANYAGKGHFRNGDADIQIALSKTGSTWMIEGFHVNSPLLLKRLGGAKR
jgi:hypothetical protein